MDVRELVSERFPGAVGAIVAGSTTRQQETATSDVDLVVFLDGRPAPMRCTERHQGRLVEFFVHTEDSLRAFLDQERARRRSPLLHMVAWGHLVDDTDRRVIRLQDDARQRWAAGPDSLDRSELEERRYVLTALLDDLADERDSAEAAAIAAAVFVDVADVALVSRGAWSGSGRWLVRHLRHTAPQLCAELRAGLRDALNENPETLLVTAQAELNRLGGRLDEGYHRRA